MPAIQNIFFNCKPGKLYIVLGSIGSGKTSLIHACLGELFTLKGESRISGKIGYVPQYPFNSNDILRNNITYGKEFDLELYLDTLVRCGLTEDIKMFPSKDLIEIGERGVNLSGG